MENEIMNNEVVETVATEVMDAAKQTTGKRSGTAVGMLIGAAGAGVVIALVEVGRRLLAKRKAKKEAAKQDPIPAEGKVEDPEVVTEDAFKVPEIDK